jgi:hypothetical protein
LSRKTKRWSSSTAKSFFTRPFVCSTIRRRN